MSRNGVLTLLGLTVAFAACGDESGTPIDAPIHDARIDGAIDAPAIDATTDAATIDAAIDAATIDAATIDAATIDAATTDAAATDAATTDAAATDAAAIDASTAPTAYFVIPDNGLATATTTVAFTGLNLEAGTTVTFNGVAGINCTYQPPTMMSCQAPPGPIGRGLIVLTNSGGTTEIFTRWTYTGVRNETDLPAEVDYCNVQFPSTLTVAAGADTAVIYGRIFENGLTQPPGEPILGAELGYGPAGSNPTTQPGWRFSDATYNVQVGNDDEYMGTLRAPATPGTYAYAFRFGFDGGLTWTYCDLDGAGANANLDFSSSQLGLMTVTP